MNAEEKQALIEHCQLRIKVLQTFWHPGEKDMTAAKSDLKAHEIAIAALTAQPVKLPKSERLDGNGYGYYFDMNDVFVALENAGINFEVQE